MFIINKMNNSENQSQPILIFLFTLQQWRTQISPITKIDIVDIAPIISKHFYYDEVSSSYVFTLLKTKWDSLQQNVKKNFMTILRRSKEEIQGIMNAEEREKYENCDLFDVYMKKKVTEVNNDDNSDDETKIDLDNIIQKLE